VAVKISFAVVQEFTSWYHQKGALKNRTIALMQEPDSDTYVGNQWPKSILQQYNSNSGRNPCTINSN